MIKSLRFLGFLVAVLPFFASAAEPYQEGKHYIRLENPVATSSKNKIEVAEAFWYGCPHCFHLEPLIKPWKDNLPAYASFKKVPAQFGRIWKTHARLFYTLNALKLPAKAHDDAFYAINTERRRMNTRKEMVDFVSKYGVSEQAFDKAYKSFGVKNNLRKADKMIRDAKLAGVPALIINGKYKVSASEAGGTAEMLKVAKYLVEQEQKRNAK